ncbi:MAG: DUF2442 domain-containing protein [Flavobacteriia bacterium]|nr:DUF2442 domain-containing protein [Flavobacteriia bacterium]
MKIVIEYKENETTKANLKVVLAKYLSDFAIRITFNDGTEKLVDFKSFLDKSLNPSIKKYLDESNFSKFKIVDGNLNWSDYDLIFPIRDLYKGKID